MKLIFYSKPQKIHQITLKDFLIYFQQDSIFNFFHSLDQSLLLLFLLINFFH